MNDNQEQLVIAIPEKKRPAEIFARVMKAADFQNRRLFTDRVADGEMTDMTGALPVIQTIIVRCYDALNFVRGGVAAEAVVGLDTFKEYLAEGVRENDDRSNAFRIVAALPVSECTLKFITPPDKEGITLADMKDMRIATSNPDQVREHLREAKVSGFRIVKAQGAVEAYVRHGLADIGCDIVESGDSVRDNGLVQTNIVVTESSSLIVRANRAFSPRKEAVMMALEGRLKPAADVIKLQLAEEKAQKRARARFEGRRAAWE